MANATGPYRADHVGSLLRPPEILDARGAGTSADRLREIEDRHILRVLARQRDLVPGSPGRCRPAPRSPR